MLISKTHVRDYMTIELQNFKSKNMKKLIFGAFTALLISGTVFANETIKDSKKADQPEQVVRTYCKITVITRNSDGDIVSSSTTYYEVSSGEAGAKQCDKIKKNVQASLSVASD